MIRVGTIWLVACVMLVMLSILVTDVVLFYKHGRDGTITAEIRLLAQEAPILTWMFGFMVGVIVGHLFWTHNGGH